MHFWVKRRHYIFGTSIPGQIRKNSSRAFEGLSYFVNKIQQKNYSHNSIVSFQKWIFTYTREKGQYSLQKRDNWIMWIKKIYNRPSNAAREQFLRFLAGIESTYKRFSAAFWLRTTSILYFIKVSLVRDVTICKKKTGSK